MVKLINTLGVVYCEDAYLRGLEHSEKNFPTDVFVGNKTCQVSDKPDARFWGGGGKPTLVNNLESAKKAIKLIIDQGEGYWTTTQLYALERHCREEGLSYAQI